MFTVIVTTHDRPLLLQRALQSLAAQTFRDFTTIVVSDSSQYIPPYAPLQALPGPFFYLLRNGRPGPADSRNCGIALTETPYALFLDDDDSLAPEHLAKLAEAITAEPPAPGEILYCDFSVIFEERNTSPPTFLKRDAVAIPGIKREHIYISNLIPNNCLVFPRDLLKAHRFDPELILLEDWDHLLGCLREGSLRHIPINTVNIHKSHNPGEKNQRRGNTNNEHLFATTLAIYRRHPSPDPETRELRRQRFAQLDLELPDECA